MGLFDKVFRRPNIKITNNPAWQTLTAYQPVFFSWSGNIYESELVRSAIHIRATHISKLGIAFSGTAQRELKTRLKNAPNEFQTWGQFLYRLSTILDATGNAVIVPIYNEYGEPVGIFPILPSNCSVVDVNGEPYLKYKFSNGTVACMEMSACGIMTKYQFKDDIFGEGNNALRSTMELVNLQQQAIKEGVKSSATYRFMASLDNFALDEDIVAERKKFSAKNFASDSENGGLLLFPNNYRDIRQIDSKPFVVDTAQMQLIHTNVYNYFNVNEKVLQSAASEDEMDAFFNGVIEPFSIQLSDVLTKMFFTNKEQSIGNRIMMTSNRLQYMSVSHKIELAKLFGDRGAMMIDEMRELFNYAPLPDGAGEFAPIRGEYYNSINAEKEDEDGDKN